jgi:hypothetical protein
VRALWTIDLMVVVAGDLACRLPDSLPAVAAAQFTQALRARCHRRPALADHAADRWCRLGYRVRHMG